MRKLLKRSVKQIRPQMQYNTHYLLMLALPAALMIVFRILPVLGNVIAFRKYRMGGMLLGENWVGMSYFNMFLRDPMFWTAFMNSCVLSVMNLVITFPIPIAFAILINEIENGFFRRITQTISYLPRFLATVIVIGILRELLSPDMGLINQIIVSLGMSPVYFMNEPAWFRTIFIGTNVWQYTGYYAIVYIAALSAIDTQLYEAASIDGAGRFRKMLCITLPGIQVTVIYMLLLSIGYMLSLGYDKSMLLYTPTNSLTSDIIETFVYRMGIKQNSYSYSSAVGLFSSVIAVVLLVTANALSKRFAETSLF